ncbi:hypothetical protein BKA64DRAFT_771495 [Cadophora sp. MPI-SDFR-AT-0126]|nr:hypothetical protein BKA64DRAFT_771495 [Leotiomycetes sp. MPI-SDFR-AT-0126]
MEVEAGKFPTTTPAPELQLPFESTGVEVDLSLPHHPFIKPNNLRQLPGGPVDESPATSVAISAADHLVDGNSPVNAAEARPDLSVVEAAVVNAGVSPSGYLAIEASSSTVGVSPPDHLVAEASYGGAAVNPVEEHLAVATSVAVDALQYFVNEVLYMNINGYEHAYCNQDIIDAQSHGITLEHWIVWKFENGVDRAALCG